MPNFLNMSFFRKKLFFFIILLGLLLRLIGLSQSLWHDEAIGVLEARDSSYKEILIEFPKVDNHPPLYYLVLKGWSDLFGYSEVAVRSLSVVFGILTVFLIYKIAQKVDKKKNNLFPIFSALLIATSQLHIYYSQEARMYMMAAFLASLAIFAFLSEYWLIFSLSLVSLMFTDYVPIFLLPMFWVYGVLKREGRAWWIKLGLAHLPLLILGLVWSPVFLHQIERGQWVMAALPGWQEVAGGATAKQLALVWMKFTLGRISFLDKTFYYSLIILASVPFLVVFYKALKSKKHLFIWLWFLLPLVLGFLVSFVFPAFIYFRFLFVLPAFYLIVAWGISQLKNNKTKLILGLSILSINLISWLIYATEPYQQREQWKQVVSLIEQRAKSEDEAVVFAYFQPPAAYRWYEKGKIDVFGLTSREEILPVTEKYNGIYYFEYLADLSDPGRIIERTIAEKAFKKGEIFDFPGVGQVRYWSKGR